MYLNKKLYRRLIKGSLIEAQHGQEMNFSYNDKQYFIQGWTENGFFTLELCQTIPLTTNEGYCVWKDVSDNSQTSVSNFLDAKLFNGKTFWEAEQKIDWLNIYKDSLLILSGKLFFLLICNKFPIININKTDY